MPTDTLINYILFTFGIACLTIVPALVHRFGG